MSDDLIDRARAALADDNRDVFAWAANRLVPEMADEITRLRSEMASGSFYQEKDIDAMQDEITRLRAEVERLKEAERTALERWRDAMAGEISSVADEITARIARENPEVVKVVPLSALVDFFAEIVASIRALTPEASHE